MTQLRVEGEAMSPRNFDFAALSRLPGQIADIGRFIPGREGGGVRLRSILNEVGLEGTETHITLESADGKFAASVPLEAVRDAIIAYRFNDGPLPPHKGGPFRFFIPHAEECAVGGVDACANVKFLGRIRLSRGPGRDTRPTSEAAHKSLHIQERHEHLS
ncbi:MAG: molybdopterin-dependent oxidoreductase [Thermodesulfobacteriota bacterium]|jgi:2-dehydropantoate 2-reductase